MIKIIIYLIWITVFTSLMPENGIEVRLLFAIYMSLIYILYELIILSKNIRK